MYRAQKDPGTVSLEFEITHDQACLDDFYNNMYVPYITLRYGKSAYVEPKERILRNTSTRANCS